MARVAIVTAGHFCTSPRVWREADALAAAGFDVVVIGVSFDPGQVALDRTMLAGRAWRHRVAEDLCGGHGRSFRWLLRRAQARAARGGLRAGIESPHALGSATPSLLAAARAEAADLTMAHLEAGLWVGARLLAAGARVGVDMEDWHSENDAGQDWGTPEQRRFVARLERDVLRGAVHATTTSDAMAAALAEQFGGLRPVTIYNASAARPFTPAPATEALRLVWFSQTLGAGRGLEDLCAALPLVTGDWRVEIRTRASREALAWLYGLLPDALHPRVHVEPPVPPDDLPAAVAAHDVGLALESPRFRNKDLTASNKICEYLQCGLSVVASSTAGQREVLAQVPGGGRTYRSGDAAELADLLSALVQERDAVRAARVRIHSEANTALAYEHQATRLVASVRRAIESM